MQERRLVGSGLAVLIAAALMAGCGGKEERLAAHMQKGKEFYAKGDFDKARVEIKNVLQIDPKQSEAYFVSGEIEEKQRNWDKAFANYKHAVELDPNSLPALAKLGNMYLFGGAVDKAEETANEILKRKADDTAGLVLRAALLVRKKEFPAAVEIAERVIHSNPGEEDAYGLLAGIRNAQGQYEQAVDLLKQGIKANPKSLSLRVTLAGAYADHKAVDLAAEQFREVIAMEPAKFEYRASLAHLLAGSKQIEAAEKVLREAIAAAPAEEMRHQALSDFLLAAGRRDEAETVLTSAIEANPDAYPLRFRLAQIYVATKRTDAAEKVYDAVVQRDKLGPNGLRARNQLAMLRIGQQRTGDALALIGEVLKQNPHDNDALLLRGQLSLEGGDAVGAIADFRSVLKDQPDSIDVATRLARAHLANNEPQLAVETMATAAANHPKDAAVRLLLAEVKRTTGDTKAAMADVDAVLRESPGHPAALAERATIEIADKRFADADKTLVALSAARPDDAQIPYRQGMLWAAQGKFDRAEPLFEKALAKRPGAIEPLSALADGYLARSQADKAVKRIEKVLADNPKNLPAKLLLGHVLDRQGKTAEAEAALRQVAEAEPKWARAHTELAGFYLAHKDAKAAEAAIKAGLAASPGDPQLTFQLAEVYRRAGSVDQAIAQYEQMLKDRPGDDAAANNLATLLVDQRGDKASFDRAVQLASRFKVAKNVNYLDTLAWAYVKAGQVDEGTSILRRVVDQAPENPVFGYHLGYALHKKGEAGAAKPLLQKAVQARGDFPGKDQAKAILATM